jgi:hypothetical protein
VYADSTFAKPTDMDCYEKFVLWSPISEP